MTINKLDNTTIRYDIEERPLGHIDTVMRKINKGLSTGNAEVPCGGCTACCRRGYEMILTEKESSILPFELSSTGQKILQRNEGVCALFVDGKCSVYNTRPASCKKYDCRIFSMAGIVPTELLDVGYIPFAISTKNRQEDINKYAMRLAAAASLRNGSGAENSALDAFINWRQYVPASEETFYKFDNDPEFRRKMMDDSEKQE